MPHLVKQNSQNEARHQHRQPFFRKLMRSSRLRIPGLAERELPLRIRWVRGSVGIQGTRTHFAQWLLGFMVLWLGLMAILGFIKFTNGLPLNDKFLHFVCFAVLASLFFLTLDIDDSARRIWYWRHLPSAVTISCCTLCASIASEFIQSLLPVRFCIVTIAFSTEHQFIRQYKEFQTGDVVVRCPPRVQLTIWLLTTFTGQRSRQSHGLRKCVEPLLHTRLSDEP